MKKLLLFLSGTFIIACISGQASFILEDNLPFDPNIVKGKLENGLTYYIRKNNLPEERVELRLVVNAGSLQETYNQQGLAHFTEHMCFNGTKNFEKNELVNFLEKMGIQFGAELNAYTSFEETVYMLYIPTDKPGLLDTAFMVLEDWASNVTFAHEEIDKERKVIVEEWRLGLGAQERMMQKYIPVVLKDTRYAERLPIGKMDIVENCPYDTLKQFYKDWYRPELIAVVVVGDIDPVEMEKKIQQHFAHFTNPDNIKPHIEYPIPNNNEPLISIVTDKEATYSLIQFFIKHDKYAEITVNDYRKMLLQRLFNQMMGSRYNEIMQNPETPFLYANSGYGGFMGRSKDAYFSFAVAKENQILSSLDKLLEENEKVKQFGFNETELEREKKSLLTFYKKAIKEKDKTESKTYAEEYIRNFLEQEPVPGIENEFLLATQFVPGISINEINDLAKKWMINSNWVVLITAPENETIQIPTEDEVKAVVKQSKEKEVKAYIDSDVDEPLLKKLPKKSKIVSRTENQKFGYTEITFKNGAKAILKPNFYKNDQVLFSGTSPGGHSLYPDEDFVSAYVTSDIMNQSGLGNFDMIALQKKLAGNTASVESYINELNEGVRGSCSPKDIETLLQLNYLQFTGIRIDTNAFKSYISRLENQVKYISADPNFTFYDTLVKATSMNHPRAIAAPSSEQINSIEIKKVVSMQEDRFADAGDFTFVFVGNFSVDSLLPLLEIYIGGLPSKKRIETWKNVDPDFPEGITNIKVQKGIEPKSRVSIVMNKSIEYSYDNALQLNVLIDILSIKLRESMREDKGGVYGVRVNENMQKIPVPEYSISISFGCSPYNVDSLVQTVFLEMKKIIDNGPEEVDLVKVKETMIRAREVNEKTNSFWLNNLESFYFTENPILTFDEYRTKIESLTIQDIKSAANRYFALDNYVKVALYPEILNQ
ncbi:MAG: insulinase family protein [Bacteroidales bacterium]|nr:insulinase family protein [Bacteroidales bacterium]